MLPRRGTLTGGWIALCAGTHPNVIVSVAGASQTGNVSHWGGDGRFPHIVRRAVTALRRRRRLGTRRRGNVPSECALGMALISTRLHCHGNSGRLRLCRGKFPNLQYKLQSWIFSIAISTNCWTAFHCWISPFHYPIGPHDNLEVSALELPGAFRCSISRVSFSQPRHLSFVIYRVL